MPEFVIPDEIKDKNVTEIGFNDDVVSYLKDNGYETVREIIENQKNIPNKYLTPIKGKLIFNVDLKIQ